MCVFPNQVAVHNGDPKWQVLLYILSIYYTQTLLVSQIRNLLFTPHQFEYMYQYPKIWPKEFLLIQHIIIGNFLPFIFLQGQTILRVKKQTQVLCEYFTPSTLEIKQFGRNLYVVSMHCNEQHVLLIKQTYLQKDETHKLLGGKMMESNVHEIWGWFYNYNTPCSSGCV